MRSPRVLPDVRALVPSVLLAALPATARATGPGALPELGLSLVRVAASLALVLALMLALAALFRRARMTTRFGPTRRRLETLDRLDVGGRREIRLLRAGAKHLVVGITDARMDLLAELDADESRELPAPVARAANVRTLTISS